MRQSIQNSTIRINRILMIDCIVQDWANNSQAEQSYTSGPVRGPALTGPVVFCKLLLNGGASSDIKEAFIINADSRSTLYSYLLHWRAVDCRWWGEAGRGVHLQHQHLHHVVRLLRRRRWTRRALVSGWMNVCLSIYLSSIYIRISKYIWIYKQCLFRMGRIDNDNIRFSYKILLMS